eukprot:327373-Rhodomonas_salina.1
MQTQKHSSHTLQSTDTSSESSATTTLQLQTCMLSAGQSLQDSSAPVHPGERLHVPEPRVAPPASVKRPSTSGKSNARKGPDMASERGESAT